MSLELIALRAKHSMALEVFNVDSARHISCPLGTCRQRSHSQWDKRTLNRRNVLKNISAGTICDRDRGWARTWEFHRDSWHAGPVAKAGTSIHQQTCGRTVSPVTCDHMMLSERGQIQKASGPTFHRYKCPQETDAQEPRAAVRAEEGGGAPS